MTGRELPKTDADKLRVLAQWLTITDRDKGVLDNDVQNDLLRIAARLEALQRTGTEQPFEPLYAPLETPDGWYVLLDCSHADPDKFQGFDSSNGAIIYDGCRQDNSYGPFKSEEEMWRFVVQDLVDLIRECHAEMDNDGKKIVEQAFEKDELRQEIERLKKWVDDLQSGIYVNCVYCGHQYGPKETTPVSMADALKAHIEQCPKHPMSVLRALLRECLEWSYIEDPGDFPTRVDNDTTKLRARIKTALGITSPVAGCVHNRDDCRRCVDEPKCNLTLPWTKVEGTLP
jgi:hypothetical protein